MPKPDMKEHGIGAKVRDGTFEFTVIKVKAGVKSLGSEFTRTKARGQFVLVTVSVENLGDEARSLSGEAQNLYDTQGRHSAADTEAATHLDESNSVDGRINAGGTLQGVMVFDVPKGAELAKIELHHSAFSGGGDVVLTK